MSDCHRLRPMSLPRRIAWRYLRRPSDRLVSAVGMVSIFGLVIGVMALVISMALMTGYRDDLQRQLLGGNAEIFVYAIGGSTTATGIPPQAGYGDTARAGLTTGRLPHRARNDEQEPV